MKKTWIAATIVAGLSTQAWATPTHDEARQLVKSYMGQLKPELKKGMKNGGPVNAIDVCHTKAPQIAADLSEQSGWHINRVSLKPRAKSAQPDAWEEEVLTKFNQQLAEGTNPKKIEFSQTVIVNGEKQFRYMKAIPTGNICLACHGTDVKAPVKEAIAKHYPQDQATGYEKGELRGAFSFTKPL
ncbi:DUF3365 domain-containing protein [Thiomicrospira sp. WB1]|jgi:hypothetical protein|uniref:Tll0287-like domain-containing protein n=1 Tax=Thiomicrospira sp. WB1 TaxID=1685380 RepID=UPI000749089D|nr:DUF3365 domain-containing protein [Thiomicrospira sp. WB1]KUJ71168.1 glutamate synthase [Thiomicrospira sp. WB1]